MEPQAIKLPIGLVPRYICDDLRLKEIDAAVGRYEERNYAIPEEWIEERNEIMKREEDRIGRSGV